MSEDVYPWDVTLVLAYGCEIFTLYPTQNDPALAFQDALNEAEARDREAAAVLLASVG